jgi:hypothetical protein
MPKNNVVASWREQQQRELGEDHSAFSGRNGALVEGAGILEDGRLVDLGNTANILLLLVHGGARGAALTASSPLVE